MIGAREQTRAAAALGHFGAAVPAHIQERAQLIVTPPYDQDRHPGIIIGTKVARRRPLRSETHHDRVLAKQDPLLLGQTLGIGVGRHLVAPGRGRHRGRPGVDVMQQSLQEADLVLPAHRKLRVCGHFGRDLPAPAWRRLDTVPYHRRGSLSIRYRITIQGSVWQSAAEVSAYYFCSISIKTLAQAATRLARLRGFSSNVK